MYVVDEMVSADGDRDIGACWFVEMVKYILQSAICNWSGRFFSRWAVPEKTATGIHPGQAIQSPEFIVLLPAS
jgi:hypothetical protein